MSFTMLRYTLFNVDNVLRIVEDEKVKINLTLSKNH